MYARIWSLTIVFLSPSTLFGQGILSLSSGISSGSSAAVNLTLSSPAGSQPAGIQWTLTYSPRDILSIDAVAAGGAVAAGKAIQCSAGAGIYTCLLVGQNSNLIQNGLVAVVNLTLAAGGADTAIGLIKTAGATRDGLHLGLTGTGGNFAAPLTPAGLDCIPELLAAGESSTCTVQEPPLRFCASWAASSRDSTPPAIKRSMIDLLTAALIYFSL